MQIEYTVCSGAMGYTPTFPAPKMLDFLIYVLHCIGFSNFPTTYVEDVFQEALIRLMSPYNLLTS